MAGKRKYNDEEIAAIFEQATRVLEASRNTKLHEGLTLAELQEIGADSGIPAAFIAQAAAGLDQPKEARKPPVEYLFGSPTQVSNTVDLPRMPTEDEWNALVVDLRTTFDAQGALHKAGDFRQWTNGNLQIFLEPMGEGSRLRMTTKNASGISGLWAGPVYIGMALMMLLLVAIVGKSEPIMFGFSALISLAGMLVHGYYRMKMPAWSSERQAQMQSVGDRMIARMTDTNQKAIQTSAAEQTAVSTPVAEQKSAGPSKDEPAPQIDLDEAPSATTKNRSSQTRLRS
ncbi:MAG: hypothetical protein AAF385_10110 [Pseudomonadota bacterium]